MPNVQMMASFVHVLFLKENDQVGVAQQASVCMGGAFEMASIPILLWQCIPLQHMQGAFEAVY